MAHHKQQALVVVSPGAPQLMRAAAYVRMSHDHQEYSPFNQMALIKQYASDHGMQIVKTYSDEGISGLRIENRPGLRALLTEVVGGQADFSKLLVYDISRWGRFQDIDESAHYEFLCRRAGVDIVYCAEIFGTDHSLISTIGKVLKRGAAAEFSRELSVKIFRGKCTLASRGFAVGGTPPYGMRAILIQPNGKRVYGPISADRKVYSDYRVSLVPGSVKEVRIVKEIFRRYVELRESVTQVMRAINASGATTRNGRQWCLNNIIHILENEKYAGSQVYGMTSRKLGTTITQRNPSSEWVRKPNAFPSIVDPEVFQKARELRREAREKWSDEELLRMLRRLLARRGRLTQRMIERQKGMPNVYEYTNRFGSLFNAYRMIDYYGDAGHPRWRRKYMCRSLRTDLMESAKHLVESAELSFKVGPTASWCRIGDDLTCSLQLMRYREGRRRDRWYRFHKGCIARSVISANFHILARLDPDRTTIRDFFLVPGYEYNLLPLTFGIRNPQSVDRYRIKTFDDAIKRLLSEVNKPKQLRSVVN